MTVFVGSSIFIDALHNTGIRADNARKLLRDVVEEVYGKPFTSDYVLDEYVSSAVGQSRACDRKVRKTALGKIREGEQLIQDSSVRLIHVDDEIIASAKACFSKYVDYGLTITDWTSAVIIGKFGIKNVLTFDEGFDNINSIPEFKRLRRIH